MKKVLSIALMVVLLVAISSNFALAFDPASISGDPNASGTSGIKDMGSKIIGVIQTVGSVLAVAILVVLGIKYMMGSTEEKAEYKKTLVPYVIGAILIFAASNVAGIAYDLAQGIS